MATVIERTYPRLYSILTRAEIEYFTQVLLRVLSGRSVPVYVYSKLRSSYFNKSEVGIPINTDMITGTDINYDVIMLYFMGTIFKMGNGYWSVITPGWIESIYGKMDICLYKWHDTIRERLLR